MDTLGKRIKTARKAKGWTQGELAKAINVTSMAISRYETGSRTPRFDVVQQLCVVLNKSEAELYLGITEDELAQKVNQANAEHRQRVEDIRSSSKIEDVIHLLARLNDDGYNKAIDYLLELSEKPEFRLDSMMDNIL